MRENFAQNCRIELASLLRTVQPLERGGSDVDAATARNAGSRLALFPIAAFEEKSLLAQIQKVTSGISGETGGFGDGEPFAGSRTDRRISGRVEILVFGFAIEQRDRIGGNAREHGRSRDALRGG